MTQAKPAVREMTRNLVSALELDMWPSAAICIDFGIETDSHLGALRYAVLDDGVTLQQLDAALGSGPAIQKLISDTNPYRFVVFKTDWDRLLRTMDFDHPRWSEFSEKFRKAMNGKIFSAACLGDVAKLTEVLAEMGMDVEMSLSVLGEYQDELNYLLYEDPESEERSRG